MAKRPQQTPASTAAVMPMPTTTVPSGMTVVEDRPAGTREQVAGIADLGPTDPPEARCNVAGLAVLRLGKATILAAISAGTELAGIEQDLGAELSTFITTKTMLSAGEARTMINFAAQAALTPEGLTPAVAVPLTRVLEAVRTPTPT